jgi:exodeoxyribonuclease V gamma subunit
VAERLGIAAHLHITFLHRYLAGINPNRRVLDATILKHQLLGLFHDPAVLIRPEFSPVRQYLNGGGEDEDGRDLRRLELADHLSHLFDEYTLSRADLLANWETGTPDDWQGNLWRMLRDPKQFNRPAHSAVPACTLETLVDEVLSQPSPAKPPLHIFGLSYFASAYHRMLVKLAQHTDVHLYLQIPCREEEAVIRSPGSGSVNDPFGLASGKTAGALWGRPSRENLRLLLVEPETQYRPLAFSPSRDSILLGRLQNDIALQQKPQQPFGLDDSIAIFPCPSLRREIEVIAAEIWCLLEREPSMRLSDILVVVPEAKKPLYLNQIPQVFRESSGLPHNLSDLSIEDRHPVAHALSLLLNLPFLPLTRKSLLPILTHPCIAGQFPDVDVSRFAEMLERLGIVREASRNDLPYLDQDLFSFDQGLRRMALGAFFDDEDEVWLDGEPYVPAQLGPDRSDFSKLGLLCCSLVADARFARGLTGNASRPLGEWLEFIVGMIHGYIHLDEHDQHGKSMLSRFFEELIQLREQGLGTTAVRFRIAARLAQHVLETLPWSQGQYLASGVTVASFVPMRSIPFRAVFVLGLSQGQFPRRPGLHELDLRKANRRPGDVDPSEQDLNLFLETLLSTQDFLGLSYVARDEVTGDLKPPSQVLWDLRALLADGHLTPQDLAQLFRDDRQDWPPLHRHEDVHRRDFLPEALAEHRVVEMSRTLGVKGPILSTLARLPEGEQQIVSTLLSIPLPFNQRRLPIPTAFSVTPEDLFRFLVDPLQGSARFNLQLRSQWESDPAEVEDEPFDVEKHTIRTLVERCMFQGLLQAQGVPSWEILQGLARKMVRHEALCGHLPSGLLGRRLHTLIDQALIEISAFLQSDPITACSDIRLAEGEPRPPIRHLPALRTTIERAQGPTTLTLHGPAGLVLTTARGQTQSLAIVGRPPPSRNGIDQADLYAFIHHLVLTAKGRSTTAHDSRTMFLNKDNYIERRHGFARTTPQIAQAYLMDLGTELCLGGVHGSSVHPYLFPHEAVFQSRANGTSVRAEIHKLVEKAQENDRMSISSDRGGVPDAFMTYGPPDEAQAQIMLKSRFDLFFKLLDAQAESAS